MICKPTRHDYRAFDARSVVCRKCGDQRFVSAQPGPWWWSPYTVPYYQPWYPPFIVSSGTAVCDIGTTTIWNGTVTNFVTEYLPEQATFTENIS